MVHLNLPAQQSSGHWESILRLQNLSRLDSIVVFQSNPISGGIGINLSTNLPASFPDDDKLFSPLTSLR